MHVPSTLRFDVWQRDVGGARIGCATFVCDAPFHVQAPPIEHYHLQVPLSGSAVLRHGDDSFTTEPGRCALLISPGEATSWESCTGFAEIEVNIEPAMMHARLEHLIGSPVGERIVFRPDIDLSRARSASLARLVTYVLDESCAAGCEREIRVLEPVLVDAMLLLLPHSHSAFIPAQPRAKLDTARRAIELLQDDPECSIERLAVRAGVSVRTLQLAFRRALGCSPLKYARVRRLDATRDALLASGPGATVTDIAFRHGQTHLGRFSAAYLARFGELPSATLRRVRDASRVRSRARIG